MATKLCPNCGWRKDISAEVCHCGYAFGSDKSLAQGLEEELRQDAQEPRKPRQESSSLPAKHPITAVVESKRPIAGLKYVLVLLSTIVGAGVGLVGLVYFFGGGESAVYIGVYFGTPIGALVGLIVGLAVWDNRSRNEEFVGLTLMVFILLFGWIWLFGS